MEAEIDETGLLVAFRTYANIISRNCATGAGTTQIGFSSVCKKGTTTTTN